MIDVIEDLAVERPVAGGEMLARHDGQIVLVSGAIPGERVRARVERAKRGVLWARAVEILEPSADRRPPQSDPACGGLVYGHIAYQRQRALKAEVVVDAFRRIAKIALERGPTVRASPEQGYRWRARLHVRNRRAGFFLEGTHRLCDAGPSRQLMPASMTAVAGTIAALGARADLCESVVVAENADASERVLHLEPRDRMRLDGAGIEMPEGVTGITARVGHRSVVLAGQPRVSDNAGALQANHAGLPADATWTRGAESFFQGNRFLTGALVTHVLELGRADRIADLYAGVGLFAVAFAASGAEVLAVEGDAASGSDLDVNAEPWTARLTVVHAAVEDALTELRSDGMPVVVVDPPRAGLSRQALAGVLALRTGRVVYVSCDPATLARDAALLVEGGYEVSEVDAFDLFPNTAHIETVAVFDRKRQA